MERLEQRLSRSEENVTRNNKELLYLEKRLIRPRKEEGDEADDEEEDEELDKRYGTLKRSSVEIWSRNQNGNFECSRRPIQCPRIDCKVNVAFSSLTHHFIFDHPEIPILTIDPGIKSTIVMSHAALSYSSSRCLALLLVSNKLSGPTARVFNSNQLPENYRNRLPLSILAAKLYDCGKDEIIIIWIGGLDVGTMGPLRCSIQAIDNIDEPQGKCRSLTYNGPINSLRTAQCPEEILINGDCVVMHKGFVDRLTSNQYNLNINVIVH